MINNRAGRLVARIAVSITLISLGTGTLLADEQMVSVSRSDCQRLVKAVPDSNVAYRPGVDVRGRPVASASVRGGSRIKTPEVVSFGIDVDMRKYMGGPKADAKAAASASEAASSAALSAGKAKTAVSSAAKAATAAQAAAMTAKTESNTAKTDYENNKNATTLVVYNTALAKYQSISANADKSSAAATLAAAATSTSTSATAAAQAAQASRDAFQVIANEDKAASDVATKAAAADPLNAPKALAAANAQTKYQVSNDYANGTSSPVGVARTTAANLSSSNTATDSAFQQAAINSSAAANMPSGKANFGNVSFDRNSGLLTINGEPMTDPSQALLAKKCREAFGTGR